MLEDEELMWAGMGPLSKHIVRVVSVGLPAAIGLNASRRYYKSMIPKLPAQWTLMMYLNVVRNHDDVNK